MRQFKITDTVPKKNNIKRALDSFSRKEWIVFMGLVVVLCVSTLVILESINKTFMVSVPMQGGTINEGIVGTPRFINPVLAFSDADLDLVSLIYGGLMRKAPDGTLIPDLASGYVMSKDGLTYTFSLKDNIFFQDGTPVTADDVVFTITEAKDPIIKSPHKKDWDGITVTKVDEKTVLFTLKQPYASFLDNTTLGIMPAHLWSNSPIELNNANVNPIGSGPYKLGSISKESSGTVDAYNLTLFDKFILGKPYVKDFNLHFYSNENDMVTALENGNVDQISSIMPENAQLLKTKGYRVESTVLPRIFGLFFNQNQNKIFTDKNVAKAINLAVDKNQIIQEVLGGYGLVIHDPIPPNFIHYQNLSATTTAMPADAMAQAQNILAKDGWNKGSDGFLQKTTTDSKKKKTTTELQFSISTGNAPELAKTAELIRQDLTTLGMKIDVKTFDVGNLNQSVIRPRKYDALLFGEIINNESDLFAFWDSSQRNDPGLNVAMYTNASVDKILGNASITVDDVSRIKQYTQFEQAIEKDMPAVFLYSPDFIYVVSKNLQQLDINNIISPADRFSNVYQWYTNTDNVWKIFTK